MGRLRYQTMNLVVQNRLSLGNPPPQGSYQIQRTDMSAGLPLPECQAAASNYYVHRKLRFSFFMSLDLSILIGWFHTSQHLSLKSQNYLITITPRHSLNRNDSAWEDGIYGSTSSLWKLLVLSKNTWNHIGKWKLFGL